MRKHLKKYLRVTLGTGFVTAAIVLYNYEICYTTHNQQPNNLYNLEIFPNNPTNIFSDKKISNCAEDDFFPATDQAYASIS
ncbi:MAG: hypothetical protein Fur0025_47530 [Oscillatoriaceae cyanobacterium]